LIWLKFDYLFVLLEYPNVSGEWDVDSMHWYVYCDGTLRMSI